MENEDCKNHIVLYLDPKISTLVSTKIRHLYLQKNGIKLGLSTLRRNLESPILGLYWLKLNISGYAYGTEIIIDKKIRNKIISLHTCTQIPDMYELDRLPSLRVFKYFPADDPKEEYLEYLRLKNIQVIIFMQTPLPTKFRDFEIDFCSFNHMSGDLNFRENIVKLYIQQPITGNFPNLKKLYISPRNLIKSEFSSPQLEKITYIEFTPEINDPKLAKYSGIPTYFNSLNEIEIWEDMEEVLYSKLRENLVRDAQFNFDEEQMRILCVLEKRYQDLYPYSKKTKINCGFSGLNPEDFAEEIKELFEFD